MSAPGAEGGATTCPTCDSENINERSTTGGVGDLAYQCQECGTEFDETGARIDP